MSRKKRTRSNGRPIRTDQRDISRWQPLRTDLPEWITRLDQEMTSYAAIRPNVFPSITSSSIVCASDYSGQQKQSKFDIIATIFIDRESLAKWNKIRRRVRDDLIGDDRRLSFKALSDGKKKRAVLPFLRAADELRGLLLVVSIHKSLSGLFAETLQGACMFPASAMETRSGRLVMERALRVAFFNAFFVSGLVRRDPFVHWLSDQDEIVSHNGRQLTMSWLTGSFMRLFSRSIAGHVVTMTTAADGSDRGLEDLAAIPDLVATPISYIDTDLMNRLGVPEVGSHVEISTQPIPEKGRDIYSWWMNSGISSLKRMSITFFPSPRDNALYDVRFSVPPLRTGSRSNVKSYRQSVLEREGSTLPRKIEKGVFWGRPWNADSSRRFFK